MRRLPAHIRLLGPGAPRCDALVLILQGEGDPQPAERLADRLRSAMPRSEFALFEVDLAGSEGLPELDIALTETCVQLGLQPSQVVLLGHGRTARLALDAALKGAHPISGAVVVCPPPDADAPMARWRLVRVRILHRVSDAVTDTRLRGLLDSLRARQLDVRCMFLPAADRMSEEMLLHAAEVFLVELVASASQPHDARSVS